MAYGQQTALRTRTTEIRLTNTWTELEASLTWNSTDGESTRLSKRFAVKVYVVGPGGANRVALSYDNSIGIKQSSHWIGAGQFRVEPAATGTTLYGRAKLASGINHIRVIVVEYGH